MLNDVKFNTYLCNGTWAEAANTAMLLKSTLLTLSRTLSPFQQVFRKKKRSIISLMQKIGEMHVATYRDNTNRAKLANHDAPGIWVGTTSYEGSNDEEELEMVPILNYYNNSNVVSDPESESNNKEAEESIFDNDIEKEVKATP